MKSRDEKLAEEAAALWREVCDGPPPEADAATLLDMITGALPDLRYERLRSPFLRPAVITGPGEVSEQG